MNQKQNDIKESFKNLVLERRSIRNYDENVKIPREELEEMLTLATRAPSSTNLQPWRFVIVDSVEGKEKLLPISSFNSRQVKTSSAIVAVFIDLESEKYLNEIYSKAVELGYMPQEVKESQVEQIAQGFKMLTREQRLEVGLIDSGLVSMQFMLAATAYGYSTNPIGGYDRENIAEVFGLDKERYQTVMIISVGKAVGEGYPTYRLPISTVASWH